MPDIAYATLAKNLEAVLPPRCIVCDDLRTLSYGTDASFYRLVPKIVLTLESEADLTRALAVCSKAGAPVTFRAAGTSLSGQAITDSVLMQLGEGWRGAKILDNGAAIALQPGVIGAEANRHLHPFGRKIGPDPASISAAMIGGIAANNSSGMCCGTQQNSYHTVRSMRLILADGAHLDTGDTASRAAFAQSHGALLDGLAQIAQEARADSALAARIKRKFAIKNTTGYSLNALVDFEDPFEILQHLIIGSEGTLGFIAEITYRTVVDAAHRACALLFFDTLISACEAVTRMKPEPVAAVELIDRAGLACMVGKPGMPDFLAQLPADATALLVEIQGESAAQVAERIEIVSHALQDAPPVRPIEFSSDARHIEHYWKLRKGLFPAVGANRPVGTTVIIEDVAVPIDKLAAATADLQAALLRHGYHEAIIFGHALDGNLHFVFAQGFGDQAAIDRYASLMDEIAEIIVNRYDGSLKAEHGTGRNMAPFVEMEWGRQATDLMWRIKRLFDPGNLLNPGVILNTDPQAHLKNLKPMQAAHPLIDRCIECGFCEPMCPTRGLTVTPRQRIVGMRETARLPAPQATRFRAEFIEFSIDSCATCGLCETACPVGINTGSLSKAVRATTHGGFSQSVASALARNYGAVTAGARAALRLADLTEQIGGDAILDTIGRGMGAVSKHLPKPLLQVNRKMTPLPAKPVVLPEPHHSMRAVYFASCTARIFGPARDDDQGEPLAATLYRLLDKAGIDVILPDNAARLCCGQPFESKGFEQPGRQKADEALHALRQASENGCWPIFSDTSPCSQRLQTVAAEDVEILDIAVFLQKIVLPRLHINEPIKGPIALHLTCSTRRMGQNEALLEIANACCENVVVPPDVGCCAFAGDKGFTRPQMNAHALRHLADQTRGCISGYSSSRTCEIGLSAHSGIAYRSIAALLDKVAQPRT